MALFAQAKHSRQDPSSPISVFLRKKSVFDSSSTASHRRMQSTSRETNHPKGRRKAIGFPDLSMSMLSQLQVFWASTAI
jgi:hypothetical protein